MNAATGGAVGRRWWSMKTNVGDWEAEEAVGSFFPRFTCAGLKNTPRDNIAACELQTINHMSFENSTSKSAPFHCQFPKG